MKKISVVTPVYKVEKYIANFINSIAHQTFKDFELILVNDVTTDNSINVAVNLLKTRGIAYKVINRENAGQSSARNAGINLASGDWIVIPDSDDVLQKDYLEAMYRFKKIEGTELVVCDIKKVKEEEIFFESKKKNIYEEKTGREFFLDFILHKISIGPYSLMINSKFLKTNNIWFNENSRYSEEFTFICDLLFAAKKVVHLKDELYNYCLRKGSVSTSANIDIIFNGYSEILKSSEKYKFIKCRECTVYNRYALPRWVLATARFSSSNYDYKSYNELMIKLNAKKEMKRLLNYPEVKTRTAACVLYFSKRFFYIISRLYGN